MQESNECAGILRVSTILTIILQFSTMKHSIFLQSDFSLMTSSYWNWVTCVKRSTRLPSDKGSVAFQLKVIHLLFPGYQQFWSNYQYFRFLQDDSTMGVCCRFSLLRDWNLISVLSPIYFSPEASILSMRCYTSAITYLFWSISFLLMFCQVVQILFICFRWNQIFSSRIIATVFEYGNFYFNVIIIVMALLLMGKCKVQVWLGAVNCSLDWLAIINYSQLMQMLFLKPSKDIVTINSWLPEKSLQLNFLQRCRVVKQSRSWCPAVNVTCKWDHLTILILNVVFELSLIGCPNPPNVNLYF